METIDSYDKWLEADGPVAISITERLEPAQNADAVFFPPTFAPQQKGEPSAYVIDDVGGKKIALVDSVGSQANRLEPIFKKEPYSHLVPKAEITIRSRTVSLFDAGHRAADAIVRFSDKQDELSKAFQSIVQEGNSLPLAKLAPTSIVFGVWDSRGSGAKLPRLVGSTIRAYDVYELKRSAQYISLLKEDAEPHGLTQDVLSELGMSDAPAVRTHGGIIAKEGITREGLLNLVALRALAGPSDHEEETKKIQRYILGLALVSITAPWNTFLREGCLLVASKGEKPQVQTVNRDGTRADAAITADSALSYAKKAAEAFVVGQSWKADFDNERVKKAGDTSKKKPKEPKEPQLK